ncbi:MAG: hypothetical protein IJ202_04330, partial [Bacteroidales bacterium]|nr:hypothetical protein [Bacteroidales bacterium]
GTQFGDISDRTSGVFFKEYSQDISLLCHWWICFDCEYNTFPVKPIPEEFGKGGRSAGKNLLSLKTVFFSRASQ